MESRLTDPSFRERLHQLVSMEHNADRASRTFSYVLAGLILTNILGTVLESVPSFRVQFGSELSVFNTISIVLFTIEYMARIWSASPRWSVRLRYAARPMLIIDLLAILPWYLPLLGVDLRVLRLFRLLRVIRLLDLGGYASAHRVLRHMLRASRFELLMTLNLVGTLMLISSSAIYYVERHVQPEHFGSIPASMWWAVVTLTTVGYGDVYPITTGGRVLGAIIASLGIGVFALPTAILGGAFMDALKERRAGRKEGVCPHCGRGEPSSTSDHDPNLNQVRR